MKWIKVETKPPSYKDILVTDGERCWVANTFDNLDVFITCHPDYNREPKNEYGAPYLTNARPTHWMPLPELPND